MNIIDTDKRYGFVCLPSTVNPAEITAIRHEAHAVIRQMFRKNGIVEQVPGEQGLKQRLIETEEALEPRLSDDMHSFGYCQLAIHRIHEMVGEHVQGVSNYPYGHP